MSVAAWCQAMSALKAATCGEPAQSVRAGGF
jgi:hypothetical protein